MTAVDGPRAPRPPPWVLMYHSVGDRSRRPVPASPSPRPPGPAAALAAPPRACAAWASASCSRARAAGRGAGLVGLTFDDGYADFLDHGAAAAAPRTAAPPPLFVLPGRLGGDNAWDPLGPRKPLLTADGIREAAAAGHGDRLARAAHLDLTKADDDTLQRRDCGDSRDAARAS